MQTRTLLVIIYINNIVNIFRGEEYCVNFADQSVIYEFNIVHFQD